MEDNRLQNLFDKALSGTITDSERLKLEALLALPENELIAKRLIDRAYESPKETQDISPEKRQAILNTIYNTPDEQAVTKRNWPRLAGIAAAILIACLTGVYFITKQSKPAQQIAQNQQQDIAPGRNQATLTLANGQKIILTKGLNGKLAQQGQTAVQANSGNNITYITNDQTQEESITYNTLTTTKGEQSPYPLILADGTQVWLNAASSITFPTRFSGPERSVTVTGEAYVIVAHNAKQPFKLIAAGQTIKDIGTEFDINAYGDEPKVITTLAEGSINIIKGNNNQVIKPGQQALTTNTNEQISLQKADLDAALAWKNGKFDFNNADVPTVMRQIARWYDVDIQYENGIPSAQINGAVYRNTTAQNALKIVRLLGIPYRIEGRKIIITNHPN